MMMQKWRCHHLHLPHALSAPGQRAKTQSRASRFFPRQAPTTYPAHACRYATCVHQCESLCSFFPTARTFLRFRVPEQLVSQPATSSRPFITPSYHRLRPPRARRISSNPRLRLLGARRIPTPSSLILLRSMTTTTKTKSCCAAHRRLSPHPRVPISRWNIFQDPISRSYPAVMAGNLIARLRRCRLKKPTSPSDPRVPVRMHRLTMHRLAARLQEMLAPRNFPKSRGNQATSSQQVGCYTRKTKITSTRCILLTIRQIAGPWTGKINLQIPVRPFFGE